MMYSPPHPLAGQRIPTGEWQQHMLFERFPVIGWAIFPQRASEREREKARERAITLAVHGLANHGIDFEEENLHR